MQVDPTAADRVWAAICHPTGGWSRHECISGRVQVEIVIYDVAWRLLPLTIKATIPTPAPTAAVRRISFR